MKSMCEMNELTERAKKYVPRAFSNQAYNYIFDYVIKSGVSIKLSGARCLTICILLMLETPNLILKDCMCIYVRYMTEILDENTNIALLYGALRYALRGMKDSDGLSISIKSFLLESARVLRPELEDKGIRIYADEY